MSDLLKASPFGGRQFDLCRARSHATHRITTKELVDGVQIVRGQGYLHDLIVGSQTEQWILIYDKDEVPESGDVPDAFQKIPANGTCQLFQNSPWPFEKGVYVVRSSKMEVLGVQAGTPDISVCGLVLLDKPA